MSPGPAHLGDLLRAARVLGVSDPAGMTMLARAMGLTLPSASRTPSAGNTPPDGAPAGRGRAAAPPPRPPRGGDGTPARTSDPPGRTDKPDATAGTAPSRPGRGLGSASGPGRLPEPDTRPPTGGSLLLVRAARPAPDAVAGRELWREGVAPDPGDDDAETLLGHTEAFDVPWATAPPLPASPWNPQTERAIFLAVASTYRTGRAVDHVRLVDLVVRGLAGGRVARQRVPYRSRPTTRAGALLLIDRGESMRPFRHDQEWAARLAARILPPGGLRVLDLRIIRGVSRDRGRTWDPHPVPPHGQPVILLSDLGHLQPPLPGRHHSSPAGWLPYLRRLREAGTSVVCLTPYPAEEYPAAVRRTVALVPLDRRVSVRFAQTAARQDPRRAGRPR